MFKEGRIHMGKADHIYKEEIAEKIQYLTATFDYASGSVPSMKARFNN